MILRKWLGRVGFGMFAAACLLPLVGAGSARAAEKPPASVEAQVYSTMPSSAAHRPEMAMDGDAGTYFQSDYGMDDGDEFLVLLSQPIPVQSLAITTGDADGQDILTNGFVETSPDAIHYVQAAVFDSKGAANTALHSRMVQAIRIRLTHGQGIPALVLREIVLTSPVKVSHVMLGPGRGLIDISRAPDLSAWAGRAETQMEEFWPDTDALLYSDRFIPPNLVHVVYRTGPDVPGVAATGGGVMTVNAGWCRAHPEDTGLTVHETAHVIQAYSGYNPVWLVEGIADYIRWVKFEPEHFHPRINVAKSTYHDAYQTSATFLAWCELHYDSGLVTKLSRAVRFGAYNDDLFKKYCGKDVDALWTEFIAAYQADPVNIITTPQAAADRPHVLPDVKAGSSVPVDLSSAFSTVGITQDAAMLPDTSGVDGEGSSYSSALLGTSQTWKNVQFQIGPAGAPDVVTCQGNIIMLPPGNYASLWLLGTGIEGNQMAQTFTVTYADGTHQDLAQNLSDWYQPRSFPGESRAVPMPYRNTAGGAKDARTFYLYSYGLALDSAKPVKSLTLPRDPYVKILAVTLAK